MSRNRENKGVTTRDRWMLSLRITGALLVIGVVLMAWRSWDEQAMVQWTREAGPVPFFIAMTVLPALGVPTTPLYILAGATFGITAGLIGTALSVAANLLLSYWIAHGALRPWLEGLLRKTRYELPDFQDRNPWVVTGIVRLAPAVPAFIKNYLLGLANIPLNVYFLVSMAITGFYAALFVVLGESLPDRDTGQALWVIGILGVAVAVTWWVRQRKALNGSRQSKPTEETSVP